MLTRHLIGLRVTQDTQVPLPPWTCIFFVCRSHRGGGGSYGRAIRGVRWPRLFAPRFEIDHVGQSRCTNSKQPWRGGRREKNKNKQIYSDFKTRDKWWRSRLVLLTSLMLSHEGAAAYTLGQTSPASDIHNKQMISCGDSMFTASAAV
jgi:hypothetical protein